MRKLAFQMTSPGTKGKTEVKTCQNGYIIMNNFPNPTLILSMKHSSNRVRLTTDWQLMALWFYYNELSSREAITITSPQSSEIYETTISIRISVNLVSSSVDNLP